jgi:hypothetical protein
MSKLGGKLFSRSAYFLNQESRTTLFCTTIDHPYERAYLCTLQRGHQFVQYLKHEDIILVYAYIDKEDDFNKQQFVWYIQ